MNFLFILNTFYPNIGGVENATFEICKRLKQRSHNIYVLTTTKSNFYPNSNKLAFFENIDGIQIYRVRYALRIFGIPLKAFYLAKKFQIEYIYVTDFWGFSALFLKKIFRIPFVYVLNGFNPICPHGTLIHEEVCQGFGLIKCLKNCHQFSFRFFLSFFITRLLISEAQPVITISKAVKDVYLSFFGKIPIKLIYYCVDIKKFQPLNARPSITQYNLEDTDRIILFFGRLIKERGIVKFIHHFNELLEKLSCKLIIVGLGPDLSEIKAKINALGLQENVILTGFLRNQKLINVINLAQVVILPILFPEPLSLVVLEAMACAKPVISFELGGVKELLEDMKTGLLIPPHDWAQFTNKILQLLRDDELRASLGIAARRKVEKYFNWNQFIDKFLKEIT